MKLSYRTFAGTGPRVAPRLLPDTFGQIARNTKFWSGELRPYFEDTNIKYVAENTQSIYKYRRQPSGEEVWLSWNIPVNVVKEPVFNDEFNRIIVSGLDGGLRVTDSNQITTNTSTINNSNSFSLAIPRPSGIIMSVSGEGDENLESRSYVVALVREWNDGKLDVGQTSDPAQTATGELTIDVYSGQTVTLTNITVPANAYSEAGVRKAYVYRSVVGSTGDAGYLYVGEFNIVSGQTTYTFVDDVANTDLAESAVSLEWDAPIDSLQGIISLSNGILAAFSGYDVYFSFPYQPHAWPYTYRVAVDYPIVGLGAFGNNIVVCTESVPVLVLVTDPAAATVKPIQENIPCMSARSIVNTSNGVIYATKNGLCRIASTAPEIITKPYFSRDEWVEYNPDTMLGAFYNTSYYAGFTNDDLEEGSFILDLDYLGNGIVTLTPKVKVLWSDIEYGDLYSVRQLPSGQWAIVSFDTDRTKTRTFTWKSKIDVVPEGIATFSAARVLAPYSDSNIEFIPAPPYTYEPYPVNSHVLGSELVNGTVNMRYIYDKLEVNSFVIFRYYVNQQLRFEKNVFSNKPFRLPAGFRGDEVEMEVVANIPVHAVEVATSIAELQ